MSAWREEVRAQLRLAIPVITLQVGLMMMGVVDTLMMGRVSEVEMAGVGIGNTWHFGMLCFGLGVLQALDPVVSQAFGARDRPAIARAMQRGIALALMLSLPVSGLILSKTGNFALERQARWAMLAAAALGVAVIAAT